MYCLVTSERGHYCVDLDVETGKVRSKTFLSDAKRIHPSIQFTPVRAGDRLICPCPTNECVSLINDGQEIEWRTTFNVSLAKLFRLDATGRQVLVHGDGNANCLDSETGELVWSRNGLGLFPSVRDEDIQIVGSKTKLIAIERATGTEKWNRELKPGEGFSANGTMHDGELLVPMIDGTIQVFDARTGKQNAILETSCKLGHLFSIDGELYSFTHHSLLKLSRTPSQSKQQNKP